MKADPPRMDGMRGYDPSLSFSVCQKRKDVEFSLKMSA